MFEDLQASPADKILGLMAAYRADTRPDKVDLGVGVYRDETGATPVFRAIKDAERRLIETQDTKTYIGLEGDTAFSAALTRLVLGAEFDLSRAATVQSAGGSGALLPR